MGQKNNKCLMKNSDYKKRERLKIDGRVVILLHTITLCIERIVFFNVVAMEIGLSVHTRQHAHHGATRELSTL